MTETVAVPVPPAIAPGVTLHDAWDDVRPDSDRPTSPANPLAAVDVTVKVMLPPVVVDPDDGAAVTEKSGAVASHWYAASRRARPKP